MLMMLLAVAVYGWPFSRSYARLHQNKKKTSFLSKLAIRNHRPYTLLIKFIPFTCWPILLVFYGNICTLFFEFFGLFFLLSLHLKISLSLCKRIFFGFF
jgi:hypothetical protein